MSSVSPDEVDQRVARLHAGGVVDLHFDLLMDLYEKRARRNVLRDDFLGEFEAGCDQAAEREARWYPEFAPTTLSQPARPGQED